MICMLLGRSAGLLHTSLLLIFYRNVSVTLFKVSSDTTKLPDPRGSLSTTVPSSSIDSANAEVKQVIKTKESESSNAVRGGVSPVLWMEQFWNDHLQKIRLQNF